MQTLDVMTASGFKAIAEAFGERKAWQAKIARLEALVEADKDFRWFSLRWERELSNARFELAWLDRG